MDMSATVALFSFGNFLVIGERIHESSESTSVK